MTRFLLLFDSEKLNENINIMLSMTNVNSNETVVFVVGKKQNLQLNTNCKVVFLEGETDNLNNIISLLKQYVKPNDLLFTESLDMTNVLCNKLALQVNSRCLLNILSLENKADKIVATKYIYSNNLYAEYDITDGIIATVKLDKKFKDNSKNTFNVTESEVKTLKTTNKPAFELISKQVKKQNNLKKAKFVVLVGKGVKKDKVNDAIKLASMLNAEVGATRPVTYDGIIPLDRMVGSSNISVSPKVLLALGVSGSAPLISGIKNSEKIISVNTDKRAMIFNNSNIAVVCDSSKFIDQMIKSLEVKND